MGVLRNFREVVKNLKHKPTSPKLCPRCGSPKLRLSTRFDMWLFPEQYICSRCGYKGIVTLELEQEEEIGKNDEA
jgi:transposase